jgi:hypothetical protein
MALTRRNRGLAEDLALLTQLPDLTTQPAQLITLGGGAAVAAPAGIQVGALDPLADRGLGQVQLSGDLADRLAGVRISSTTSALHSGGQNRRGVASDSHLEGRAPILGVHQAGSTPCPRWSVAQRCRNPSRCLGHQLD